MEDDNMNNYTLGMDKNQIQVRQGMQMALDEAIRFSTASGNNYLLMKTLNKIKATDGFDVFHTKRLKDTGMAIMIDGVDYREKQGTIVITENGCKLFVIYKDALGHKGLDVQAQYLYTQEQNEAYKKEVDAIDSFLNELLKQSK